MDLLERKAVRPFVGRIVLSMMIAGLLQAAPASGVELSILETVEMDFGAVIDRDGSVVLGLADAITDDPTGIHAGGVVATGEYLISGDPFAAFSLSIVGSTAAGLTIGDFRTNEGVPPLLSVPLNGTGEMDLRLGARLTVSSGAATPGLDQPLTYVITIDYN